MTSKLRMGWRQGREGQEEISLPLADGLRHTAVMGMSGSGKTYGVLGWMAQLLASNEGVSVTYIDPKGEGVEKMLALLQVLDRTPPLAAEDICIIAPGSGYGVPLNPLAPAPGLDAVTQASVVVGLLDDLSDGGLGPRMVNIARWLVRAVMELGGSLLDVHALLVKDGLAARLAARVRDPELRTYLTHSFSKEPSSSRESIRARIENLLALPATRACLCAQGSIDAAALLDSPLTLVHLGTGNLGSTRAARFVGSWIFMLTTAAIFARQGKKHVRPAYVVVDEAAQIAKVAAEDIEDVLSRARSAQVNLVLCNQFPGQYRAASPALWEGITANVALEVLFRPQPETLSHIEAQLPVTGRVRNPLLPDRLLSEAEEKKLVVRRFSNLMPREAVFVDRRSGKPAEILTTHSLPMARAEAAWARLSDTQRDRWWRGRYGGPLAELPQARIALPEVAAANTDAGERTGAPTKRRGKLVIP